jgi:hypothetical protein
LTSDEQIERAVLEVVVDLSPNHLTTPEIVLKVATDNSEDEGIRAAINELKASGLVRGIDGVVAPTHAALQMAALIDWP